MAGVSRSAAIVIGYLIKYKKWTLRRAYKHIIGIRPVARPNSKFLNELVDYERQFIGTLSSKVIVAKRG